MFPHQILPIFAAAFLLVIGVNGIDGSICFDYVIPTLWNFSERSFLMLHGIFSNILNNRHEYLQVVGFALFLKLLKFI